MTDSDSKPEFCSCGKKLTDEEIHYYGASCEECEKKVTYEDEEVAMTDDSKEQGCVACKDTSNLKCLTCGRSININAPASSACCKCDDGVVYESLKITVSGVYVDDTEPLALRCSCACHASSAETGESILEILHRHGAFTEKLSKDLHNRYFQLEAISNEKFSALPPPNSVVVSRECATRSMFRALEDTDESYGVAITKNGKKDYSELKAAIDGGAK